MYGTIPTGNPKSGSGPFISEKKNRSDCRVHGIQIDRLGFTVSTQKSVLKNMHRVPRNYQKIVQIGLPNQTTKIWHILADITYKGVRASLSAILDTLPMLGFSFFVFSLVTNRRFIWALGIYFLKIWIYDTP